jgi:outer membrane lipopolysaccharide assembly protein LptE/RlpB
MITMVAATAMLAACGRGLGPRATAGAQQERQRDRIEQGQDTGELTNKEARELRNQQRDIKEQRQDARSDGVVTPKERQKIKNQQNEASTDIYDQKHDDDTR